MTIPNQPKGFDDELTLGDSASVSASHERTTTADIEQDGAVKPAEQRPAELGNTEHLVAPPRAGWLVWLVLLFVRATSGLPRLSLQAVSRIIGPAWVPMPALFLFRQAAGRRTRSPLAPPPRPVSP